LPHTEGEGNAQLAVCPDEEDHRHAKDYLALLFDFAVPAMRITSTAFFLPLNNSLNFHDVVQFPGLIVEFRFRAIEAQRDEKVPPIDCLNPVRLRHKKGL
jgi:hypothetical protein